MVETSEQVSQHLETLLGILQSLGFIINQEKSLFTPTQEIEFLGLVTNSQSMELSLPGEKLRQIKGEAARLLSQQLVSTRALYGSVFSTYTGRYTCVMVLRVP